MPGELKLIALRWDHEDPAERGQKTTPLTPPRLRAHLRSAAGNGDPEMDIRIELRVPALPGASEDQVLDYLRSQLRARL
ncbi:MAG: hypothetical protein JO264_02025 [Acidisphaera sp.]|nr:hypothetical protein [Acidisphaera sp.]